MITKGIGFVLGGKFNKVSLSHENDVNKESFVS